MGGLNYSAATCASMIRMYNQQGNGKLNFQEFQQLFAFINQMQAAFQAFDRQRDGKLDFQEIQQAWAHAGFQLDHQAFMAVCRAFDPFLEGKLDVGTFVASCVFLHLLRSQFAAFDPNRTGNVGPVNFSQLAYIVANCR